jgi:hypothetical protein
MLPLSNKQRLPKMERHYIRHSIAYQVCAAVSQEEAEIILRRGRNNIDLLTHNRQVRVRDFKLMSGKKWPSD